MWLYTDIGFFSIVQKDGEGTLTVRARVRDDLTRFIDLINSESAITVDRRITGLDIIKTTDSDYPYRLILRSRTVSDVLSVLAFSIKYRNFKDQITSHDPMRATIYQHIWQDSMPLECLDDIED